MTLSMRHVSFAYENNREILSDISLSVKEGSFTAILGPNGHGKTTLLKLFNGILAPSQGNIFLDEAPLTAISKRHLAQSVAHVPQEIFPTFSMSVYDFVLLGRAPHLTSLSFETPKDHEIAETSLKETDAFDLKDRFFHTLSGGEKQRVLLAKALTQSPKILLLDEPTAHLDLKYQFELMAFLKKIHRKRGLTILMVIHDPHLASEFADELVFLKAGSLYAQGAPKNLLTETHLKELFGVSVGIDENPFTHNVRITYKDIQ